MKRLMFQIFFALPALATMYRVDAAVPTAAESATAKRWIETTLLAEKSRKPFSFVYGEQPSSTLPGTWKFEKISRELDSQRRQIQSRGARPSYAIRGREPRWRQRDPVRMGTGRRSADHLEDQAGGSAVSAAHAETMSHTADRPPRQGEITQSVEPLSEVPL